MPTIGTDCHITLEHANVNGGAAFGFVLAAESNLKEGVYVKREVFTDDLLPMKVWTFFDVILADDLLNPDNTAHEESKNTMYLMLMDFLDEQEDIILSFVGGSLTSLGAIEFAASEKHYPGYTIVRVQLTNLGEYFGLVITERYDLSLWDGTLTWETSYWR